MKTNMRQTSLDAYQKLEKLAEKRRKVFDAIDFLGEACNLDVAYHLQWSINRVTPRTNELVKMGLVKESKRAITPRTDRKVIYWKTT